MMKVLPFPGLLSNEIFLRVLNDHFYITQSQTKTLHVMNIAGRNAVKFMEYVAMMFLQNAYSIVCNANLI